MKLEIWSSAKCGFLVVVLYSRLLQANSNVIETVRTVTQQQKEIQKLVQQQAQIEREYLDLEAQQKELQTQIDQLQVKTETQTEVLRERLKALYYFSEQGFWQFFFSNNSAAELDRNLRIMASLNNLDIELIDELKVNSKNLANKSKRLSERSVFLKSKQAKLFAEEKKLSELFESRKKSMASLKTKSSQKFIQEQIKKAKDPVFAEYKKQGLNEVVKNGSLRDRKGQLPWPVQGSLVRRYGVIQDDDFENIKIPHLGVLIGTEPGQNVSSIAAGEIEYIGTVPYLGLTVIVSHGDQYHSVYSGLKEVNVRLGETVTQNQSLARSGKANLEETSGIYFEIRQFSETSDPVSWMKGTL